MNILVVINSLSTGGITSALANMINSCPEYNWCILPLKYSVPDHNTFKNVTIEKKRYLFDILLTPFSDIREKKNPLKIFIKLLMFVLKKIIGQENLVNIVSKLSIRTRQYDIAMSYNNDIWYENGSFFGGSNSFTKTKVRATLKLAWIHALPEYIGLNKKRAIYTYKSFDRVINVSYASERCFLDVVPDLKEKCAVVYNFINFERIRNSLVSYQNPYMTDTVNLLTVARIENRAKRIDRIVRIAQKLKSQGLSFMWLIIGDGPDLMYIKSSIESENLNDVIQCLGERKEPFIFMKYADVLVLTSDYEAYPMVICESLACGTPVICTDFPAAYEMITNGINGYVVKKQEEEFYMILSELIQNKGKIIELKMNCSFQNDTAKKQLHQLIMREE
ncbi:MAG TPA: glycosyltransferase [Defluviitaleaceae bacterium]|jgi:glycosyltransferase involved in cell wall biosynthesis|nr:glycosyltransferase [Defluviitaleaceae bacterium]